MQEQLHFTPPLTCIEVGGLTLRLELIYVVQVFTRCSCDVSSIPVVVVTRRDSSRDRNNVHPISSCRKCSRPEERESTGNDTDGLWCIVECVSLSQPLSNYLVIGSWTVVMVVFWIYIAFLCFTGCIYFWDISSAVYILSLYQVILCSGEHRNMIKSIQYIPCLACPSESASDIESCCGRGSIEAQCPQE